MEDEKTLEVLLELKNFMQDAAQKNRKVESFVYPMIRTIIVTLILSIILGLVAFAKVPYDNTRKIQENEKEVNLQFHNINENFQNVRDAIPTHPYMIEINPLIE